MSWIRSTFTSRKLVLKVYHVAIDDFFDPGCLAFFFIFYGWKQPMHLANECSHQCIYYRLGGLVHSIPIAQLAHHLAYIHLRKVLL